MNRSIRRAFALIVVASLVSLFLGLTTLTSVAGQETKHVFVLNSFNRGYTWTDTTLRGIDDAFSSSGIKIETYVTFMDMKRIPPTPQYFRQIKELIREGYKGVRFDAVLACDNDAFEFTKKYRDELFPGVPVVFSSINDFDPRMLEGRRDLTGTSENADYTGTIKAALKLFPATKNIVIVTDDTTTGKAHRSAVDKIRPDFPQSLGFTSISLADMTMDELAGKLAKLEKGSIVLLLQHFKDKNGTSYTVQESTPLLTKSASVPVFVLTDIRLGLGALGGLVVSGYHHGEAAAQMVVKILKGIDVTSIPVLLDSPNKYMFDYSVMQRFNIAEKDLPQGSILINRPVSLLDQYRPYLYAILVALIVLSGFVIYLLFEIRERKRSERDLRLAEASLQTAHDKLQEQNEELQMNEEELRSQNDELLDAEWKFQALYNNGPIGVAYHRMIYDDSGNPFDYFFIDANANFIALTGVDPRGKTVTQAFPGIKKESFDWIGTFGRVARTGETIRFEQYLQSINRWYDVVGYPYKPDHFVATFVEITDRKMAEEALQKSESRWKFALEGAGDGVWDWNIQTGEAFYSQRYKEMLGFAENDFGNTSDEWLKRMHPEDASGVITALQPYLDGKTGSPRVEFRMLCKDGRWKWIVGRGMVVSRDSDGKPLRMIGTNTDITDRKLAEEQLKVLSQRLLLATSSAHLAVWDWNVRDNQLYWDDRMFELYGTTRETFSNSFDAWLSGLHPEDKESAHALIQSALNGELEYNTVFRILHPDGTVKHIKANALVTRGTDGTAERMIGINYDITERIRMAEERQELEKQLIFAQKMESLGVLAGGIAHDFNNILAIIMGNCSLAKMDSENADSYIPEIEKASDRAAALCRQMLAYAGKAHIVQSKFDLGGLVDEMVKMLRSSLPQNAMIKHDCSADIPPVSGDASQIRQVVMNLIINASEAIGESQGEIIVSLTKTAIKDGHQARDHQGKTISPGWYVSLEVTDNGCGMDNETRERIFEPFYTTKFTGRGLGMSAVLGIITSHGGALQLFSHTGQGTTFKVYLPIQTSESAGGDGTPHVPLTPWQGSGTILLVEDEDQVRSIAKALINHLGFSVIDASNGKEALELYLQNAANITLVVTDIGMPVMNGYELFRELKILRPELPIIISSGFGDVDVTSKIARDDIAGLIGKPYSLDQLREVLRDVVEEDKVCS